MWELHNKLETTFIFGLLGFFESLLTIRYSSRLTSRIQDTAS